MPAITESTCSGRLVGLLCKLLEQSSNGIMGCGTGGIYSGGLDQGLPNSSPMPVSRLITLGLDQEVNKPSLQILSGPWLDQVYGSSGVFKHLGGLQARNIIKEPAATGKHV